MKRQVRVNKISANGNLVFISSVSPVITSLNSSVDTNSREAVLDCYAYASPTPLVSWHFLEDVPSESYTTLMLLLNFFNQLICYVIAAKHPLHMRQVFFLESF